MVLIELRAPCGKLVTKVEPTADPVAPAVPMEWRCPGCSKKAGRVVYHYFDVTRAEALDPARVVRLVSRDVRPKCARPGNGAMMAEAHVMRSYDDAVEPILAKHGYDAGDALANFRRIVADRRPVAETTPYAQVVTRLWQDRELVAEGWGDTQDEAHLAALAQLLEPRPRYPWPR